jgi:sugar phosphate isomerase/epimerase
MIKHDYRFVVAAAIIIAGSLGLCRMASAGETGRAQLANPLFAMNFALHEPGMPLDAQARVLKELGYRGTQHLGTVQALDATIEALDRAGLELYTAAVMPYDIPVDPGGGCPPGLKDAVRKLTGRKTLLLIQFVSSRYAASSTDGDARAVELGRELADYARDYGGRIAVYPHVGIWCERVDHAVRVVNQCDRKNLGVCFNLFHWLRTDPKGDLDALVRQAMPRLFLVTINGMSAAGAVETLDRSAYDVESFLRPFVVRGYRGPIGLQCVGLTGQPRENLAHSMDAWRELSARLATLAPRANSTAVQATD